MTRRPRRRESALYGAIAGAHACTVPATRADSIGRGELLARVAEWEATA